MICMDCQQPIEGRVVWMGEDFRAAGHGIAGPYPMHPQCADQPWPLYELTAEQAQDFAVLGSDVFKVKSDAKSR